MPEAHRARNVATQDADPGSVLNGARRFLRWRRDQPALVGGDIAFIDAPEPVLAFTRTRDDMRVLVVFNLSAAAATWTLPAGMAPRVLDGHGLVAGAVHGGELQLPANGVFFAHID